VSGAIEHQNGQLRSITLQVAARQVSFPYPKNFHTTADADLTLRGGSDAQVLSGEIRVTRAEYLQGLNLLEQLASRSSAPPGPLTTDPILLGLRLNVSINSTEGLYIDNELTRLRGGMRLTLRGTPAYPSLIGRVEATSGSIFFRDNRFEITRAAADFLDRNRINPILEVRAEADVRTYRLVLDVSGDLDHLRFNVTSDPPLSTVDILTMLTTGKSVDPTMESSRHQSEITGLSAASILSESVTGVIGKRVQRIFGLQTFRVDPFLAGAENDPTARVTITERLSKDLSVTFSRNLSTNEEQIVIVEYAVSRNISVVATRDENGKYGLDFRFRGRFR
jgi:translocation and assembly module TamB